jgi:IclR family transcriptional regulator, KDG regulon repressor
VPLLGGSSRHAAAARCYEALTAGTTGVASCVVLHSAANTLRALECLAERGDVGVSEISRHLDVTIGTGHRILVTLSEMGFAEQNPATRRYRPTGKVLVLADQVRRRVNGRDRVHLHLVELMQTVRESVHLGVLDDGLALYVDKVASDQLLGVEFRVGSRLPAHSTALGMALLAFVDGPGLEAAIAASTAASESTAMPARKKLERLLQVVRDDGVAEDHGEYLPDVRCVAAPIRASHGGVIAAIDIAAPRSRFESARDRLRDEVQRSAERISEQLRQLGVRDLNA